jgi:uncharacterized membrane protein
VVIAAIASSTIDFTVFMVQQTSELRILHQWAPSEHADAGRDLHNRPMVLEWLLATIACAVALAVRPWRGLPDGPPWVWLVCWAMLPLFWAIDRHAQVSLLQPLSGASLLLLMAGWPLAVLGQFAAALVLVLTGVLDPAQAGQRWVWLGIVPATLALALGAAARRWLPNHLFVYILGRGLFATLLATAIAAWLALWHHGGALGLGTADIVIGRWLTAWGEAIITGMLVAIFVAFRPQWLATYSDALYLARR